MFDTGLILWLQGFSSPLLDGVFGFFTFLGTAPAYILLLLTVYWLIDRRVGHRLTFLFFVSIWFNGYLKGLFDLPRPSPAEVVWKTHETSPGMPSGHAQGSVSTWGYLALTYRRLLFVAVVLVIILMVSLSRLYLGVHFPVDVLGGLGFGLLFLALFSLGYARGWGAAWPLPLKLALAFFLPLLSLVVFQLNEAVLVAGVLAGFLTSDLIVLDRLPYQERSAWWKQVLKLVLGLALFVVLQTLHESYLPGGLPAFLGYAFLGFYVTTLAPLLFRLLGLAEPRLEPLSLPVRRLVAGYASLLVVLVLMAALAPGRPAVVTAATDNGAASAEPFTVLAHAGGKGLAPENTLEAFRQALDAGADVIETDVWLTRDGVPVLIHDETVDRTTDGSGRVNDLTLAEIQALDAGYTYTTASGEFPYRGKGLTIPTLAEALAAFPTTPFNIEIKDHRPGVAPAAILKVIEEAGAADRVRVASFDDATLQSFRRLAPGIPTSLARGEARRFVIAQRLGLADLLTWPGSALQVPEREGSIPVVTPSFIATAHRLGIEVHVWTVNDRADMRRLLRWGVDGIITDYPELLQETIREVEKEELPTLVQPLHGRGE